MKKLTKFSTSLLLSLLLALNAKKSFAATEFLTNGNFADDLTGWTAGGGGFFTTDTTDTDLDPSGNASLQASPIWANGSNLTQTFNATFSGTYVLNFYLRADTTFGATSGIQVAYGTAASDTVLTIATGDIPTTWTLYSYSLHASLGSSLLVRYASAGGGSHGTFYIDDVSVLGTADAANIVSNNGSAINVASAIQNINSASGNLSTVKDYLADASNSNAQRTEVAKSVTPQSDNSLIKNSFYAAQNSAEITENRLNSLRTNDSTIAQNFSTQLYAANFSRNKKSDFADATNNDAVNKNVWIQTFANNSKQGNMKYSDGYNSNLVGLAFGADQKLYEIDGHLGASVSISDSTAKSLDKLKSTNIQSYQANIYGDYNFDKYFVNAVVGFAWNDYGSTRAIPLVGARAKANYSGQTYLAKISLGQAMKLQNDFTLTPQFTVTYAHNEIDNYSEKNAGSLNLSVKTKSADFFETRIGAVLAHNYVSADKIKYTPTLSASFGHDFVGAKQSSTVNFTGQEVTFNSQGSNVYKNSIRLGTGLTIASTDNIAFSANYDFEHKTSFNSHSGSLKLKYSF